VHHLGVVDAARRHARESNLAGLAR
jgi:hypothetical protein